MATHQAVILAAGMGRRLDIFETPKPLVRVSGVPLITRTLDSLRGAGVSKIYIVVKKGDTLMRRELLKYTYPIEFIEQPTHKADMLGSLAAVKKAVRGPFMVTMCDLVFEQNPYGKFLKKKQGDISVLVSVNSGRNEAAGAEVKISHDRDKITYVNNSKDHNALEAGTYHFSSKGFTDFLNIAIKQKAKSITEVLSIYNEKHTLHPVLLDDMEWYDINTPVTLIRAELLLQRFHGTKRKKKEKERIGSYKKLKKTASLVHNDNVKIGVHVQQGLIQHLEKFEVIPHEHYYSPHYILVDKNIDKLYGDIIYKKLKKLGYNIEKICLDPGEKTKSVEQYISLANDILDRGIDRKSIIISVGGGVIKDLAGFLAATLYRGIGFISFPTTVLSQCDAAIALKQGVNGSKGKNLLGSFYAPLAVFVDPLVLKTLDERYIRDGLAECLKLSFTRDKSYFTFLNTYTNDITNVDFLEKVITRSIELKIESIEKDYHEDNKSLINQYGHEAGHAIEYLSGFQFGHGEAVAIGMRVSAELAQVMGICDEKTVEQQRALIEKYGLPVTIPSEIKPEDIIRMLRYDKKHHGGELRFVLVDKIGSIWHDKQYYTILISENNLQEALMQCYA